MIFACFQAKSLPETTNTFTPFQPPTDLVILSSNLYALQKDSTTILLDGGLTQFRPDFSNNLDSLDIRKMSNFSENFGLTRGTTTLVVERRKTIAVADTIFFKLWQTRQREYQLEFVTMNLEQPGLKGYLEDKYLQTRTSLNLNGSNHINFSITSNLASADVYRFRIIFSNTANAGILPLTFASVKAYQQNNSVNVDWKTESENNIKQYDVERSLDGTFFMEVATMTPYNLPSNFYHWTDHHPVGQNSYYRIRSTQMDGEIKYSKVVKINIRDKRIAAGMSLFPNPARSNNINLKMTNQEPGTYKIRLTNIYGQAIMLPSLNYGGGNTVEKLDFTKIISPGIYHLEIIKPTGEKQVINVMF